MYFTKHFAFDIQTKLHVNATFLWELVEWEILTDSHFSCVFFSQVLFVIHSSGSKCMYRLVFCGFWYLTPLQLFMYSELPVL